MIKYPFFTKYCLVCKTPLVIEPKSNGYFAGADCVNSNSIINTTEYSVFHIHNEDIYIQDIVLENFWIRTKVGKENLSTIKDAKNLEILFTTKIIDIDEKTDLNKLLQKIKKLVVFK